MLECRSLTKRFDRFTAVNEVSFTIEPGEVVGLLGTNGAGKTTIMKIFATLLKPTSGEALVDGLHVLGNTVEVRKKLGYLPETPSLYDHLTGREFLRFIGDLRKLDDAGKRVNELTEQFGLGDFIDSLVGTYSKGLKQRLAFAQAIMHSPRVLLLDEPILGLDPRYSKLVKDYIREFGSEGRSVLVTTHLTEMAENICGRLIIIHRGVIKAMGTLEEIKSQTGASGLEEAFIMLVEEKK
jgi:ABC-type multidrug transport system ATPase subunit